MQLGKRQWLRALLRLQVPKIDPRAILLIVGALVLCFAGIAWRMPSPCGTAVDSILVRGLMVHRGEDISRAAADVYPPLSYLQIELLAKLLRPIVRLIGSDWSALAISTFYIIAARLISAVLTLGAGWLLFTTARRLHGFSAGLFAAALYLFNPVVVYYAHTTNVDANCTFYLCLAFYFFFRALGVERPKWDLVGFFCAAAAATASKDQAAFLMLGPGLLLLRRYPRWAILGGAVGAVLYVSFYVVSVAKSQIPACRAGFMPFQARLRASGPHGRASGGPAGGTWRAFAADSYRPSPSCPG